MSDQSGADAAVRRYEFRQARSGAWLERWRGSASRRRAAVVWAAAATLTLAAAAASGFHLGWAAAAWIPLAVVTAAAGTVLNIVTNGIAGGPDSGLDEWERAQRDIARTVGYRAVNAGAAVLAGYLIVVATTSTGSKTALLAGALVAFTLAIVGSGIPSAVLAWILPEYEESDGAGE